MLRSTSPSPTADGLAQILVGVMTTGDGDDIRSSYRTDSYCRVCC
jgi:hypothetical protein